MNAGSYEVEIHIEHQLDWHTTVPFPIQSDSILIRLPLRMPEKIETITLDALPQQKPIYSAWNSIYNSENFSDLLSKGLAAFQSVRTGNGIQVPMSQGFWGTRLPLLQQGVRLENLNWGLDHSPELDAWNFDRVLVHRGSRSTIKATDGNGVVVETKWDPEPHTWHRDYQQIGQLQGVNGQWLAAGKVNWNPSGEWSRANQFHWSFQRSGNVYTPLGWMRNTGQYEGAISYSKRTRNIQLLTSLYDSKNGIYSGSRIGNLSDLERSLSGEVPPSTGPFSYGLELPYQRVHHGRVHLQFHSSNPLDLSIQTNYRKEYDWNRSGDFPQLEIALISLQQQKQWNLKSIQLGIHATEQWQRYGGFYFVPDYVSWQNGLSLFWKLKSLDFALRYDLQHRTTLYPFRDERSFHLPAVGVSKQWKKLQFHYNFSSRSPSVVELYARGVHHGAASYLQGQATLNTEHTHKIQLLLQNKSYGWQLFLMHSPSFIDLFPMQEPVLTVRGAFPGFEYRQQSAVYAGIASEATSVKLSGPLSLDFKAQLTWAQLIELKRYPNLLPCPNGQITLQYQQEKFTLRSSLLGALRQPFYTPKTDFASPPPGYLRLDLSMEWRDKTHSSWKFFITNATNALYYDYLDRFRYFSPAPGINIGIRWLRGYHHHYNH
jgi:iron complex outermembrane receptor protein